MSDDVALEIDVRELLGKDPFGVRDWFELRREVYRTPESRDRFLALVDREYPVTAAAAEKRYRRGLALAAAGRLDEARPLLEEVDLPLARYLLGRAALEREDPQRARTLLEPIVAKDPQSDFVLALAEAYHALGEEEALERLVETFSGGDPGSADTAFLQGLLAEIRGEYAEAVASWERAIAMQPDHRSARFRLAYRLDLMGRDDDAIEHYERLKQVFPVPVGVLLNLGTLYEDQGRYERALSCYKLAVAHDPYHPRARMYLVDAERSLDMYYDEEKERKDDKRAQILKIPVTDFELSVRSRNCLARMNIRTLGDLVRKTEAELLSFKNFGETSLNEIKEILRSKGLRLGMQTEDEERHPRLGSRDVDRDSVRSKPVSELDLSVRSRRALDTLGVRTVGQLADVSEDQLLACKNFGQTSLQEIKRKLADLGLSLRG